MRDQLLHHDWRMLGGRVDNALYLWKPSRKRVLQTQLAPILQLDESKIRDDLGQRTDPVERIDRDLMIGPPVRGASTIAPDQSVALNHANNHAGDLALLREGSRDAIELRADIREVRTCQRRACSSTARGKERKCRRAAEGPLGAASDPWFGRHCRQNMRRAHRNPSQ